MAARGAVRRSVADAVEAVAGSRRRLGRGRVTGAAAPALGALLAAALAVGATGCGGTQATGGHSGAQPAAGAGATPGSAGAPDPGRLKAALLTSRDIGLQSSPNSPASGGGLAVSGCEPLSTMLGAPVPAGETQEQAAFVGDAAGGPFVQEVLTTEAQSRMTADYAKLRGALAACRSLTFTVGGTKLTMALTPINLGGAGSAAKRMDTTVQGVEVNGYLAVDRIGPVVLGYAYMQAGSGSSQLASYYYRQAVAKVSHAFGGGPSLQAAGRPN